MSRGTGGGSGTRNTGEGERLLGGSASMLEVTHSLDVR